MVAANILSDKSRTANKGWFSNLGFGRGTDNPVGKNWPSYETVTIASGLY